MPGDFLAAIRGTVPGTAGQVSFMDVAPSVDGAAWNYDMYLIEYFERQKQRCERELK